MYSAFITTLFHILMVLELSGATHPARPGLNFLYTVNITGGAGIEIGLGP
jgi:hypothetical protein